MAQTLTINTPAGPAQFLVQDYYALPVEIREAYFRTDTGSPYGYGITTAGIDPAVNAQFRNLVNTGLITPVDQAAQRFVQSQGGWQAGDVSPLGPIIEGKPGGLDPAYWQQVVNLANAQGYFGTTPPRVDPATGQFDLNDPTLTADTRQKALQLQQAAATITGYYNGDPTLDRQRVEAEIANARMLAESQVRERLFAEQQAVANLASNPRNYLEASFLANARGGLGGMPAANQINTAALPDVSGFIAPSLAAEQNRPVPVSASSNALLQNQEVPRFGALPTEGGYTTQQTLQQVFDPAKVRTTDYLKLQPSEQQQFLALGSAAGYGDEDILAQLQKNLPQFKAPSFGSVAAGGGFMAPRYYR